MANLVIRKAERKKAKLRLGIAAPSGAGKTYGALLVAFGLGGKVGIIDTEHGSADLYAHLGEFDVINIEAPYEVSKYVAAIRAFEQAGYSTIIIDSLSHAWAGDGGLLDKQGKLADKSGNTYTAWRNVTPDHNALVDSILKSPCHIIATMRSKQEYAQEKGDNGKSTVRKLGMAPVQRDGMEYEFTVFMDVDVNHNATSTKDRTSMFDNRVFKLSQEVGVQLKEWLETGVDAEALKEKERFEKWKAGAAAMIEKIGSASSLEELEAIWPSEKRSKEPLYPEIHKEVVEAFEKKTASLIKPAGEDDEFSNFEPETAEQE